MSELALLVADLENGSTDLASFGRVEVDELISHIDDIEFRDTANLVTALGHDRQRSIEKLKQAASECRSEQLWKRKARLALVALGIGDTTLPIDACEFEGRPDHGARTWFIQEFPNWLPERLVTGCQESWIGNTHVGREAKPIGALVATSRSWRRSHGGSASH